MSHNKERLKDDLIQFLIIATIVGSLILIVKILSSFEIKYSKPVQPKPLSERLKLLPASAKQLSDEAKLIFPQQIQNPKFIQFNWFKSGAILFEIKLPKSELSHIDLYSIYIPKYQENNWIKQNDPYFIRFIHQITGDQSCISSHNQDGETYWLIEFLPAHEVCGLFTQ